MSEFKRVACPQCGNNDARKLHEEPDKKQVLYYSMQGTPVYVMRMKCGQCGNVFKKD